MVDMIVALLIMLATNLSDPIDYVRTNEPIVFPDKIPEAIETLDSAIVNSIPQDIWGQDLAWRAGIVAFLNGTNQSNLTVWPNTTLF